MSSLGIGGRRTRLTPHKQTAAFAAVRSRPQVDARLRHRAPPRKAESRQAQAQQGHRRRLGNPDFHAVELHEARVVTEQEGQLLGRSTRDATDVVRRGARPGLLSAKFSPSNEPEKLPGLPPSVINVRKRCQDRPAAPT